MLKSHIKRELLSRCCHLVFRSSIYLAKQHTIINSTQFYNDEHPQETNNFPLQTTPACHKNETMSSSSSSREVFRFKVIYNDGGINHIRCKSKSNIDGLMSWILTVCSKWLNVVRNGDGSIDAHLWHACPRTSSSRTHNSRSQ